MKLPRLSAMDEFKVDTGVTIDQFLTRKITLPTCLTALADALTKVKPKLRPSEFPALTDIVIANNAKVMREERRREHARQAARERSSLRERKDSRVGHSIDCPECNRLLKQLQMADDELARASGQINSVAASGERRTFNELLIASRAAKMEWVRARDEKEQHEASHDVIQT